MPPGEPAGSAQNGAATGTVHQPAQALQNAQSALAQAGQNDPVASLPAPPSDEDLLRDYQVEDDWLPPVEFNGQPYTWSELVTALNSGAPWGQQRVQGEAADAAARIFPDPDGPDDPQGGRPDVGGNHRDAFRHAYWNALRPGSSAAEVGVGHERHPDRPDRDPAREARAEAMDLYNNQIGRQIAASLGPDAPAEDVHRAIERAVLEGKLVVFNEDYSLLVPSGGPEDFPPPR
ncbi:hypothetical protein L3Q67_43955 [Saccharothrix sp. AJ9571]|nr:hypothetical protein L3Q67_43955 [Saccharothrix sp. AJ9571]